jgi:hypothetical protein
VLRVALALAVVALPASNTASYVDRGGDADPAPDVTAVRVANDDTGLLTWTIAVANRTRLELRDRYVLWLDVDVNAGSGSLGADYAIAVDGLTRSLALARWDGRWTFGVRQTSLRGRWRDGLVVSLDRGDIGRPAQLDFQVTAYAGGGVDRAPDRGAWRYSLIVSP